MTQNCKVRGCAEEIHIFYYGKGVCEKCWSLHSMDKINLKEKLKIKKGYLTPNQTS